MDATATYQIPWPDLPDPADAPGALEGVATRTEEALTRYGGVGDFIRWGRVVNGSESASSHRFALPKEQAWPGGQVPRFVLLAPHWPTDIGSISPHGASDVNNVYVNLYNAATRQYASATSFDWVAFGAMPTARALTPPASGLFTPKFYLPYPDKDQSADGPAWIGGLSRAIEAAIKSGKGLSDIIKWGEYHAAAGPNHGLCPIPVGDISFNGQLPRALLLAPTWPEDMLSLTNKDPGHWYVRVYQAAYQVFKNPGEMVWFHWVAIK